MLVRTTRRQLEPTSEVLQGWRRLNRLFDEALGNWTVWPSENGTITSAWVPPVDITEDKENLRVVVELPGVSPKDVKISLENNVLSIRGEKKQESEQNTERMHRYERAYGTFERTFTLPSTVDADRIQARHENGILTVTIPKVEKVRPREIPVVTS